jgi:HEPN domain-containing protein
LNSKWSSSPLPEFEDAATLFSLSSEFLEAASVLSRTHPTQTNYTLVTYYLIGHAAELTLKSFLFKHGDTIDDLRKYGHDLKRLIKKTRRKGLPLKISTQYLQNFSDLYKDKRTEYRQMRQVSLPQLSALLNEVKILHTEVFNHVAEITLFG